MLTSRAIRKAIMVLPLLLLASCGFGPPPSCGDEIGGTADEAAFAHSFNSLALISQSSGLPGAEGENGMQFSAAESLALTVDARSALTLRACVQPRGPGTMAFDRSKDLAAGEGSFELGSFSAGNYVIRVIVDNLLVKNFSFQVLAE